jgi:hypothetical protein
LRDLLLSGFPPKRFQGLGRKITGLFYFAPPPATPAGSTENTGRRTGPAKPRASKHPAGPKATAAPPRGGPGVPRKRCYWPIFAPFHRQHPGGSCPVGHCEATAATAGRSRPLQIQNLRPLGRPITSPEPGCAHTPYTYTYTHQGANLAKPNQLWYQHQVHHCASPANCQLPTRGQRQRPEASRQQQQAEASAYSVFSDSVISADRCGRGSQNEVHMLSISYAISPWDLGYASANGGAMWPLPLPLP